MFISIFATDRPPFLSPTLQIMRLAAKEVKEKNFSLYYPCPAPHAARNVAPDSRTADTAQ